ncbi:MAG TPA: hypothetical protein PK876_00280 [Elusimicrobiota bacterium]|nr:hypothetical protein [Elusimicrobiota bacterium]
MPISMQQSPIQFDGKHFVENLLIGTPSVILGLWLRQMAHPLAHYGGMLLVWFGFFKLVNPFMRIWSIPLIRYLGSDVDPKGEMENVTKSLRGLFRMICFQLGLVVYGGILIVFNLTLFIGLFALVPAGMRIIYEGGIRGVCLWGLIRQTRLQKKSPGP